MTLTVFVTGTDTEIGKTHVSTALLRAAASAGLRVAGFKPVAAGCERTADGLRNDDALALMRASNVDLPYEQVNPVALAPPVAPHIAAAQAGVIIDGRRLLDGHAAIAAQADLVVVEGAGGWQVPLGAGAGRFADWVAGAGWPVLLVVGMRLGCLNHALLSAESIRRQSRLAGWVANCLPPRQNFWEQNVACLRDELASPCFGVVPTDADAAAHIDLGRLLDALAD
ncbi:MAG: dethiobiotin synthase [Salinisphaeraceae bacterium]|nr:dethiobiotin synthase [Salinisphaeraceae bacterium]